MSQFYTKDQIDQIAVVIGDKIKSSSMVSAEEREKLAGLESSKFLGSFLNPESIPVEGAVAGSYADVDAGSGTKVERWIFDVDSQEFVKSSAKATADTAATVKTKYESNPNTNAFTDEHKSKLESLMDMAPAASIEDFLAAFNAAMADPVSEATPVDLSGLQGDHPDSTPGQWKSTFYTNDANYDVDPEDPTYFVNIYGNRILEEINTKYPDLNLSSEEVLISDDIEAYGMFHVKPNASRVTGELTVQFYAPL